jgi:hypothetical protein
MSGYTVLGPSSFFEEVDYAGYYKVSVSDIANLQIVPLENWHGELEVDLVGWTIEDLEPHPIGVSTFKYKFSVEAVADPPVLGVPGNIQQLFENLQDQPLVGLSAALVDNEVDNGEEILSVVISNVPKDSFFNAGSNTGGGRWSIPVDALSGLLYTPPNYLSGEIIMTLTGIAFETSNSDEASSDADFKVYLEPKASPFLMLARDAILDSATGAVPLILEIRMDDTRGFEAPGETPPELVRLTFTDVPDGVIFSPSGGGKIDYNSVTGEWVFTGLEHQANGLSLVSGPGVLAGTYDINISGVTLDGTNELDVPFLDDFRLYVNTPDNVGSSISGTTSTVTGGDGNDIVEGSDRSGQTLVGDNGNDILTSANQAHTMTGGAGADRFVVVASGPDRITDFNPSEGDQLDLSGLITGYDQQFSNPEDFLTFNVDSGTTTIFTQPGSVEVAILENYVMSGDDITLLYENGGILLA